MDTTDLFFFVLGFISFGISALTIDLTQSRKFAREARQWREIAEQTQAENEQLRRETTQSESILLYTGERKLNG